MAASVAQSRGFDAYSAVLVAIAALLVAGCAAFAWLPAPAGAVAARS